MKTFSKWLSRLSQGLATREITPQLTVYERKALQWPSDVTPNAMALEQMENDAMVQTCLTVKRLGVMAAGWKVVPHDDSAESRRRTRFIEDAFERMEGSPETVLDQAMDAFAKGWSVQESVYEEDRGQIWLRDIQPKDPSKFGLDADEFGRIERLRLFIPGEVPQDLPRAKYVLYRNRHRYSRMRGKSDLEAAYSHWQAKQQLLDAWAAHLEKFASPTMLGKFGVGLSTGDQEALLNALNNLGTNKAIVYPSEIDISTIAAQTDASTGFQDAIDFHNREIARSILGQTLTTDEGRRVGSLALGKVHLQVLVLQLQATRRELADKVMTEQVIRPLIEMNFGPGFTPRFTFDQPAASSFATGVLA